MADPSPTAAILKAAARARELRGRVTVVKLGGSALEDPVAAAGTLECLAALHTLGVPLVVVHGGGKPIDRAMSEAGIEPVKIQGRRYTDDQTLEIVVRVLGEINQSIVDRLQSQYGANVCGLVEDGSFPLSGERLLMPGLDLQPVDLGRVGRVTGVDTAQLLDIIDARFDLILPVLPCLARDIDGGWLNVNADTAAAAVAGAFTPPGDVIFLTDTPGVLTDYPDPASRLDRLTRADCERLIRDGTITGGMVPKVEACLEALDAGAARVVILDGRDPHALLAEFVGLPRPGTEVGSE